MGSCARAPDSDLSYGITFRSRCNYVPSLPIRDIDAVVEKFYPQESTILSPESGCTSDLPIAFKAFYKVKKTVHSASGAGYCTNYPITTDNNGYYICPDFCKYLKRILDYEYFYLLIYNLTFYLLIILPLKQHINWEVNSVLIQFRE